jgi:multiple sugar transport system substrate-binding protein
MGQVGLSAIAAIALFSAPAVWAQDKTQITVQRFFGTCDSEFGQTTDPLAASGECGIITALINKFNAESTTTEVVPRLVEWPGYDQLTAQYGSRDLPTLVTMHEAVLSDYQSRNLIQPLGDLLVTAGVDTADFTPAAREGVTRDGQIWALPMDNNLIAWHINLNLFKQAGLVNEDGTPVIPTSTEELYQQAEQFQKATGKPYFIISYSDQAPGIARQTYTLLYQQNSNFFADTTKIDLSGPEAVAAVEWQKALVDRGYASKDLDYAAATAAFPNGDGGVYIQGTWLLGDYVAQSEMDGRPLSDGYYVVPFPQFFAGRNASWTDGHTWAMPTQELTDAQRASAAEFLKFWWDNNFAWSRTGHVPPSLSVFQSAAFLELPQRQSFATLPDSLTGLPAGVVRQFSVQEILGSEVEAAIQGNKPIDAALADAQSRINELLANAQ